MRFQIDPLKDESQRACSAIVNASLPRSRQTYFIITLYAVIVVTAFLLTPETAVTTTMIGVAAVLVTSGILQGEGQRRIRHLQSSDPHATETHFVELGPDGIRTWCAHVDSRYAWSDFGKLIENEEFYLFVRPSGTGCAVPKRLLDAGLDTELRSRVKGWAPDLAFG